MATAADLNLIGARVVLDLDALGAASAGELEVTYRLAGFGNTLRTFSRRLTAAELAHFMPAAAEYAAVVGATTARAVDALNTEGPAGVMVSRLD